MKYPKQNFQTNFMVDLLLYLLLSIGITGNCEAKEVQKVLDESYAYSSKVRKRDITKCEEVTTIIEVHNRMRRMEDASDMKKMRWNSKLALAAERYAQKCLWEHGDLEIDGLPYKEVGQNLYNSVGEAVVYEYIINKWYEEKAFFNFITRTCDPGKICGHYTQLVWSNSSEIGCAHKFCQVLMQPDNVPLLNRDYIVCYYGPSGNYREMPLYIKGKPCSACADGFEICDDGLCSSGPGLGDIDVSRYSGLCSASAKIRDDTWLGISVVVLAFKFLRSTFEHEVDL